MGNSIASVELAGVLPGAQPLDKASRGVEESFVGLIQVGDDQIRAYIKVLTGRQLCNELVAAVTARALELPVPRVFLAQASPAVLPESELLKRHGRPAVVFASEALPHPDLSRRLRADKSYVVEWMLMKWKGWEDALIFDEWVANVDRHWRNLLLGSDGKVWLIDHGRALSGPEWKPADLVHDQAFENKLADGLLPKLTLPQRVELTKIAQSSAKLLTELDMNACIIAAHVPTLLAAADAAAVEPFLSARVNEVVPLICNRMGIPTLGVHNK